MGEELATVSLTALAVLTHDDWNSEFGEKPNRRRAEVYAWWYF